MINFYEILGLQSTATALEIKTAFRKLAKLYHPDRNPLGKEQFTKVLVAYETLSDPEAKLKYDYKLNYIQAQNNNTSSKTYDHYKNYEEQELKRRRYYEEHIKKHEKRTYKKVVEPELKENYNEFKYILYATPLAVILFLLILNLASNDRTSSPPNQQLLTNSKLDPTTISFDNYQLEAKFRVMFNVFGEEVFDQTSNTLLKIQNLMADDIVLCVFNMKGEFLRRMFIKSSSNFEVSKLPAGNYVLTICQFSGKLENNDLLKMLELANYYKNKNWIPSKAINLITLSNETKNEFVEITKNEFFTYPKKEL